MVFLSLSLSGLIIRGVHEIALSATGDVLVFGTEAWLLDTSRRERKQDIPSLDPHEVFLSRMG
jgi:hypothetical protein